ncbi:hypothetical protein D3C71_1116740 [compost metagenome]
MVSESSAAVGICGRPEPPEVRLISATSADAAPLAMVSETEPAGATPRMMSATRDPRLTPPTEVTEATLPGATPAT